MLNSFFYVVKTFYLRNKKSVIMFFICNIIEIPLLLAELFYTKYFIDTIQHSTKNFNSNHIFISMVILIAIIYVSGILSALKALSQTHIGEASLFEKDKLIIEKTLKLSMIDLDSPNTKSHREKAMRLQLHTLLEEWVFFFSDALKIVLLMVVLLYYKLYILVLLIIGLTILQLLANKYTATKLEKINQKQTSLKRLINYLFSLLVDRENIQEVKILKIDTYLKNKLANIFNKNFLEMQKGLFQAEFIKVLSKLFFVVVNMTVIIVLVLTVATGTKSGGQFILLYQIVNNLFNLVSSVSFHYHDLTQCIIKYDDFSSYLKREEEDICTGCVEAKGNGIEININNLYFSYPDSDIKALNGVNLNIKAGEKVAFIGDNGSGKSTLVKIIMGLYTTCEGTTKWILDGQIIPCNALGRETRVVFQDYAKLLRPIRENVALGDMSKINNDSDLFLALEKADADGYSKNLDNLIGPQFGGLDMSGGQWQRIAIARAFLKQGSLLIYDEATSALDPDSELKAFNSFLALSDNKTSIIVTHRLSMTRFVDKIAVIEKGKIIEYGTHEELLKGDSIYARMYYAQSSLYIK